MFVDLNSLHIIQKCDVAICKLHCRDGMYFSSGLWLPCPLANTILCLLLTEHMYTWDFVCSLTFRDIVKVSECFPSESLGEKWANRENRTLCRKPPGAALREPSAFFPNCSLSLIGFRHNKVWRWKARLFLYLSTFLLQWVSKAHVFLFRNASPLFLLFSAI